MIKSFKQQLCLLSLIISLFLLNVIDAAKALRGYCCCFCRKDKKPLSPINDDQEFIKSFINCFQKVKELSYLKSYIEHKAPDERARLFSQIRTKYDELMVMKHPELLELLYSMSDKVCENPEKMGYRLMTNPCSGIRSHRIIAKHQPKLVRRCFKVD